MKTALIFYVTTGLLLITTCPLVMGQPCSIPQPTGIHITNITECGMLLSWNAVSGASYYGVKYKLASSTNWSPVVLVGLNTNFTLTSLSPGNSYKIAVAAFCGNNKTSGFKTRTFNTVACIAPVITQAKVTGFKSVEIKWDGNGCLSPYNQIRYKQSTDNSWSFILTGNNTEVVLQGLIQGAVYTFQVNDCADTVGTWSVPGIFQVPLRPNILMIVVDDARYDSYSCNGGPSFFQSPNIDRIANEGINFKHTFAVESLCIPSRGTIVTGLYPHKHGAITNSDDIHPELPTTAKILDSAGYYTGWIGKYHMSVKPVEGYDYWLGTKVNSGTDEFHNLKYNYNGTLKTINGHDTDILTDSTLAFLDANADKTFFVTVGYHAPHKPFSPKSNHVGMYDGVAMPVPENTAHYPSNYPSFLYNLSSSYYIEAADIQNQYEAYYEMMAGVDEAAGKILDKLTDLSLIDNTLIIFMSDNGMMFGEHGLFKKEFAYDPSMRIPLFIRYPAWFTAASVITDQMALNVDIAPTILDAAGITGNYSFDGIPLRKLASGTAQRTSMYYEVVHDPSRELPSVRGVRTFYSKYIHYGCNNVTEEFFNLAVDPEENINEIKNASYIEVIQNLKNKMDSFRTLFSDTIQEEVLTCFLTSDEQKQFGLNAGEESIPLVEDDFLLYPVPASEELKIAFLSLEDDQMAHVFISTEVGRLSHQEKITLVKGKNVIAVNVKNLNRGYYFITILTDKLSITKPVLIMD